MVASVWKQEVVPSQSTASGEPDLYAGIGSGTGKQGARLSDNAAILDSMTDAQRKKFALALKAAGYKVPTTGKKSSSIVLGDALNEVQGLALAATKRLGRPISIDQYLADEAANRAATATATGSKKYDPYAVQNIYDPTKAKSKVENVVTDLLDRSATPKEIKIYSDKLKAAQSKKTNRTITTYEMIDGVRTARTTGGLDETQFLTDIIKKTPEYKKAQTAKEEVKKSKETGYKDILAKTAMANGLDINQFADAGQWASRIAAGEPIETFKQTIRNAAKLGLPDSVKNLVDQGIDLNTIFSPYKQTMASILEINPDTITVNDPTLRMAIGPDKEMSIYDFQNALRKDVRWQYTNNAKESVSSSVQKVLQDFGFMG